MWKKNTVGPGVALVCMSVILTTSTVGAFSGQNDGAAGGSGSPWTTGQMPSAEKAVAVYKAEGAIAAKKVEPPALNGVRQADPKQAVLPSATPTDRIIGEAWQQEHDSNQPPAGGLDRRDARAEGACCDGVNCLILTLSDCDARGGAYKGDGTACDPGLCEQQGIDCSNPIPVSLSAGFGTFTLTGQTTCGMGNEYMGTCLGYHDTGKDTIYQVTVTDNIAITLMLDSMGTMYPGVALSQSCPVGGNCLIVMGSPYGPLVSGCTFVPAGTYYVMVDTYTWPECIPEYTLTFAECTLPTGRCCYDPWPSCVDNVNVADCLTQYGGRFTLGDTCNSPCAMPVSNLEDCATAMEIQVPYSVLFDNEPAAPSTPGLPCNGGWPETQSDVWFKYTPPADCWMTVSFNARSYDGVMGIYSGPDCDSLTLLTCIDEPDNPGVWSGACTGGTTYWIQVGDWGEGEGGGLTDFSVSALFGPGACCFPIGECRYVYPWECVSLGGVYHGDGTTCTPDNPCPQPQPGDMCETPLVVTIPADLPYTDPSQHTCGRGNDYSNQTTCLGYYDGGEDIIYKLVVTELTCVDLMATGSYPNNNWFGIAVGTGCPPSGNCLAVATTWSYAAMLSSVPLSPGEYYVIIDTFPYPDCLTDFTLNIGVAPYCPQGACCNGGICTVEYERTCIAAGGAWVGPDTICPPDDCDNNGLNDMCEIRANAALDCDQSWTLDTCDLAGHPELDIDSNGVLDTCDVDCNQNGVPDVCEVPGGCAVGNCNVYAPAICGTAADCQGNGIPDDCELIPTPFEYSVDDGSHEAWLGLRWGGYMAWMNHFQVSDDQGKLLAVEIAYGPFYDGSPVTVYVWSDPNQDGNPSDARVLAAVETTVAFSDENIFNWVAIPVTVVGPTGTHFFVGAIAQHWGGQSPASVDMNSSNGQSWIAGSNWSALDPNDLGGAPIPAVNVTDPSVGGGMPGNFLIRAVALKPAEGDCNNNGIPDDCDLAAGVLHDCNGGGIPDECEWADCNGNGVLDACDLLNGSSLDCNHNGIPDECDIAFGPSQDCQPDGIPDECQLGENLPAIEEGFADIGALSGWYMQNNSEPAGVNGWFQGNAAIFEAQAGAPDSYIAANYNSTSDVGNISNWLLTPEVTLKNDWMLDFYTRTSSSPSFADRLQVRMSVNGASTDVGSTWDSVGDFSILLLDINPTYQIWAYPQSWLYGHYTLYLSGLSGPTQGRLAFRYFVENGGPNGANSNYIGIDTVSLTAPPGPPPNDCNQNGVPDDCDIASGNFHDADGDGIPDICEMPPCYMPGDLNADWTVDGRDCQAFVDCVLGVGTSCQCGDFNGDGAIDLDDVPAYVNRLLGL
ncbi:MAG TPA: choice-of-anchor J domain-containing protein [Phycisphaerae bacterium]|nr:choice-of-anchor J domain-containing protein [Phycisphaerae bacterium]